MSQIILFLRRWTLPISMTVGALVYFVLRAMHFSPEGREAVLLFSRILMPSLIFSMLTLTFLKVDVRDLRFRSWHVWGLLLQCSLWSLSILAILWLQRSGWLSPEWMHHMQYFIISFALCMITPTATAAAVVTLKLGGNPATLTLYTIFIDLLASLFISAFIPLLYPDTSFLLAFWMILVKVFPLLFGPFLAAQLIRHLIPGLRRRLLSIPDLAFYLWTVALALAICVTVRAIVLMDASLLTLFLMAVGSALSCALQFAVGYWLGHRANDVVAASQSLGQKNTAVCIWIGATFMDPLSSVAGGFYSVWHNVWNSYQLEKVKK